MDHRSTASVPVAAAPLRRRAAGLCRVAVAVVAALSSGPAAAQGPVPHGAETRANTFTAGAQRYQTVAMDADGDAVVAWTSDAQDGSSYGVFAQRYDAAGAPAGPEFRVNATTVSFQAYPSVGMDADGDFVVVWQSLVQDGNQFGVYGQRFAADGTARGGEFRVNTTTQGSQDGPAVAMDAAGGFVAVWSSEGQDGDSYGVYAQRFAADGTALGGEFRVNTVTAGVQAYPAVAADADGAFAVAWSSLGPDGSGNGVFGQRFAADGGPVGGEFQATTYTAGHQSNPSVALDDDGDLVVVWSSADQDGSGNGVFGQRFAADGARLGPEFLVNTTTAAFQSNPVVAVGAGGTVAVAWGGEGQDGDSYGVFGQRFAADGAPLGGEFQANTTAAGFQGFPALAMSRDGDLVVVWESLGQDGSEFGVYGQRYDAAAVAAEPAGPAALALALAPNPVGAAGGRLSYALPDAGPVRLAVYDVLGREVAVLADGEQAAGPHAVALGGGRLTPGVYVVRLAAGAETAVQRLTVAR